MSKNIDYKIWWDEKNGVARVWAKGIIDEEIAKTLLDDTNKIAKKYGGNIDWINDLSEITKPTAKARQILAVVTAHPGTRKYALVGASVFLRTISNFIITASGKKNARHFANDIQALNWINEAN